MCHIIFDTECKYFLLIIVIYSNDLSRCRIFGTKSVTSCVDRYSVKFGTFESCNNVQIQRLAHSSRLFCSVKNRDLLNRIRNCIDKCLCTERSVQTYLYNADFLSCLHQVVDRLLDRIADRTHSDDHMLSVLCSIVVEQFVICSDLSVYFVHVVLNDSRKSIVIRVTSLSCLEEDIRVLCRTSLARMVRVQRVSTESVDRIHIYQIFQIFIVPCLDLLDLVGCTESVEEVDERKFSFQCSTVSNRCQVHNLLYT